LLAVLLCCAAGCEEDAAPREPVRIVATIDGEPIHRWRLAWDLERRPPPAAATPEQRAELIRGLVKDLVEHRLLVSEARRRGLWPPAHEVEAAFAARRAEYPDSRTFVKELLNAGHTLERYRELLAERLAVERLVAAEVEAGGGVTTEAVTSWYEGHPDDLIASEEVRALHIIVATDVEIRQIKTELTKGGDFAALARERSTGPEATSGGDLGFFPRGALGDPFDACFFLEPGAVSEVLESDAGYHLFKVLERRPARRRELAEARVEIERRLRREAAAEVREALVASLRSAATIEIDEEALGGL